MNSGLITKTQNFINRSKAILKNTIFRDTIKNEYCKNKGIEFIRIPYWDLKNIEQILGDKFQSVLG